MKLLDRLNLTSEDIESMEEENPSFKRWMILYDQNATMEQWGDPAFISKKLDLLWERRYLKMMDDENFYSELKSITLFGCHMASDARYKIIPFAFTLFRKDEDFDKFFDYLFNYYRELAEKVQVDCLEVYIDNFVWNEWRQVSPTEMYDYGWIKKEKENVLNEVKRRFKPLIKFQIRNFLEDENDTD